MYKYQFNNMRELPRYESIAETRDHEICINVDQSAISYRYRPLLIKELLQATPLCDDMCAVVAAYWTVHPNFFVQKIKF